MDKKKDLLLLSYRAKQFAEYYKQASERAIFKEHSEYFAQRAEHHQSMAMRFEAMARQ